MIMIALDDEPGALKILTRAIHGVRPDAEVHEFMDVLEALSFAEMNIVDIAFLDIQMPVMSGLEVAKRLKKIHPKINVIFTTGFSEYAIDAIKLRSSGYLLKPITKSDVQMELENLRNLIPDTNSSGGIYIKTFGSFDIFIGGKVLTFRREKAKEMLAYLVDRRGSTVTRKELAAIIFEDKEYSRATQAYLTQIVNYLRKTLEQAGASKLLLSDYNSYAVDRSKFECDAYDYMEGSTNAINKFSGEYMNQYSWAESSIYQFYE